MSERGLKPHCRNGHEYTPDNTAYTKDGKRACRACNREGAARFRARHPQKSREWSRKNYQKTRAVVAAKRRSAALESPRPDDVIDPSEAWKPIPDHEHYEVSNLGRVRSLSRIVYFTDGRRRLAPGRVLAGPLDSRGYPRARLAPGKKIFLVHHLVLVAFVGPKPPGMECRHLDDCPTNNRLSNLAWGTRSENNHDRIRNATKNGWDVA